VADVSCTYLPGLFERPSYTIAWNNGQHSTINLAFTDTIIGGTEQVTAGQFHGGNATIVWHDSDSGRRLTPGTRGAPDTWKRARQVCFSH
jgi:hypothetical protein